MWGSKANNTLCCPHVRCVSRMIDIDITHGPTCLSDQLKSTTVESISAQVLRTRLSQSLSMSKVSAVLICVKKKSNTKMFCLIDWFVSRLPSGEGYLSLQLDESKILSAENASRSCLEAKVSYSPAIQRCVWETPDNTLVKCSLESWVTNNNR